jgi:hypothetical protein
LIVFTDEERNNEFALSFLVPEGRETIWKQIKMFQLQTHIDIPQPVLKDLPKLNAFIRKYSTSSSSKAILYQKLMKNNYFDQFLSLIMDILEKKQEVKTNGVCGAPHSNVPYPSSYSIISLSSFINIKKTKPLSEFQKESLSQLFSTIRDLFLMNDLNITSYLLSLENDRVKKVIDCLQYDESVGVRIPHNQYIEENIRFFQVCNV